VKQAEEEGVLRGLKVIVQNLPNKSQGPFILAYTTLPTTKDNLCEFLKKTIEVEWDREAVWIKEARIDSAKWN